MPFSPIGRFVSSGGVTRKQDFRRPVTFFDRVRFVGANSELTILGGVFTGDIYSSTWDGVIPLDLSSRDATATLGYAFDDSEGTAQFKNIFADGGELGTLGLTGTLTIGSSGKIVTEGPADDFTEYGSGQISFFSGHASEVFPGYIKSFIFSSNYATLSIVATEFSEWDIPYMYLRSHVSDQSERLAQLASGAFDLINVTPGQIDLFSNSGLGEINMVAKQTFFETGSAALPSIAFAAGTNTGLWRDGASSIGFATAGVERMQLGSSNLNFNKNTTGSASILNSSTGSESAPVFTFSGDLDCGMMRPNTNQLVLSTAGLRAIHMSSGQHVSFGSNTTGRASIRNVSGSVSTPTYSFTGDLDTGIYRSTSNQISMAIAGNNEFLLGTTGFLVPNAYNTTTGSAANMHITSDGRMRRSTSTEKYKVDIKPWEGSGILDVQPVTFYPMTGNVKKGEEMKRDGTRKLLGLTYENMLEHFPKGAVKQDKALDWNAITTALLSEVQQLKARLDKLEKI